MPRRVGEIFRQARETQRLSQHQVAALTAGRISRTSLGDIERGQSLPGVEALVALSRVLHVDPLEILERVDLDGAPPLDLTNVSLATMRERAREFFWAGEYRQALAIYDAMAERVLLDPGEDETSRRRQRARIEINRAVTLRRCSAMKAAEASIRRALQLARGFSELHAETYMVLASLYSHEGSTDLAGVVAEKAVNLAEGGSPALQGQTWIQKGNTLFRDGEFSQAREAYLYARKFLLEAKDPYHSSQVEINLGACLYKMERFDQARDRFKKAMVLAQASGDQAKESLALINLGEVSLIKGEFKEADHHAVAALRMAQRTSRILGIFLAEWLRYRIDRQKNGEEADSNRLSFLKKTYPKVKCHSGLDPICQFQREIVDVEDNEDHADD